MSLHARQPTLLRMVMDPSSSSPPTTPTKPTTTSPSESPNRTELEPTPLLLALDMAAERKRLRSRKDSVLTGAEDDYVEVQKDEVVKEKRMEMMEEDVGYGKEVVIPVKEDLNQLALFGQTVSNGFWNGVEGVRKGVWGLAGWNQASRYEAAEE